MQGSLANLIGRPDLAANYNAISVASDGSAQPLVVGPMFTGNVQTSIGGSVGVGQMSLSMLAGGVVLLLALYCWTRGSSR